MKKFLAVLVVLAMALSVSAVAFADTNAFKLTATSTTQTRFQYQISSVTLAANDEVVILVQLPDITDVNSGAAATVKSLTARVYGAGTKFVDSKSFDETWVKDLGDDWYEITFTATADSNGIMLAFFYYTDDAVEAKPADGSVMNLASITVNGTAVTMGVDDFAGEGLALAAEAATVTLPSLDVTEDETEDVTEDVTEGVEETGVVSVAVVAVAAVVGGAVVLKKREF